MAKKNAAKPKGMREVTYNKILDMIKKQIKKWQSSPKESAQEGRIVSIQRYMKQTGLTIDQIEVYASSDVDFLDRKKPRSPPSAEQRSKGLRVGSTSGGKYTIYALYVVPKESAIQKMKNATKKASDPDEILAGELFNWVMSKGQVKKDSPILHDQMFIPIVNNYNRKIKKGIYDETLALKGFENLVSAAWKDYKLAFYLPKTTATLDSATRKLAAKTFLDEFNKNWKGKEPPKITRSSNKAEKDELQEGDYIINRKNEVWIYDLARGEKLGKIGEGKDFEDETVAFHAIKKRQDQDELWTNVWHEHEDGTVEIKQDWLKFLKNEEKRLKKVIKPHDDAVYLTPNESGDNSAWIGYVHENGEVGFSIVQEFTEREGGGYQVTNINIDFQILEDLQDENVSRVIKELSDTDPAKWLETDVERRAYLLASGNPMGPEEYASQESMEYKTLAKALKEEGLTKFKDELGF